MNIREESGAEDMRWQITFTDMLTLLLTFFVFIIAISTFKTEDYKRFWQEYGEDAGKEQQPPTKSFKVDLIKGLKLPRLTGEAETLLNELEETFNQSDFEGMDVNYNENKISLTVSEQLSFQGGQFDLKEQAKPLLLKLIPAMQASPFDVGVEGHTDSLTSEKVDNMELSLNRALATARFLIKNGLDKNKVSVSGYGPHRPVADNKNPDGRRLNRRVEINMIINEKQ